MYLNGSEHHLTVFCINPILLCWWLRHTNTDWVVANVLLSNLYTVHSAWQPAIIIAHWSPSKTRCAFHCTAAAADLPCTRHCTREREPQHHNFEVYRSLMTTYSTQSSLQPTWHELLRYHYVQNFEFCPKFIPVVSFYVRVHSYTYYISWRFLLTISI